LEAVISQLLTLPAHFIRNVSSQMAQAVCALHSQARWAVTGTPVQNRLADLASLLKFIRAYPYTDTKQFDVDISQLWKSGQDEEAVKRLKRLSSCLLLRRPKTTIELPSRTDLECPVDFDVEEKEAYERIHQQTVVGIDEVLRSNDGSSNINVFVNVLQQIEALRMFCSLGIKYHTRHQDGNSSREQDDDWTKKAQSVFNAQRHLGPIICIQCASILDLTESLFAEGSQFRQQGRFSKCLKFLCVECSRRSVSAMRCGHPSDCVSALVSTEVDALEGTSDVIGSGAHLPSKIKALVADIRSLPQENKW
jgi:SNF2 family DNA or RNA helicase